MAGERPDPTPPTLKPWAVAAILAVPVGAALVMIAVMYEKMAATTQWFQ